MTHQNYLEKISMNATTILNVGGSQNDAVFLGKEYNVLNIDPDEKPDILASIYSIPLPDASQDAVISFNLLEHLETPHVGIAEIERVLKPHGFLYLRVPSFHPYHGGAGHPDYYRFTQDGLGYQLRNFDGEITSDGGFAYILASFLPRLAPILKGLDMLYPHGNSRHELIFFGQKRV